MAGQKGRSVLIKIGDSESPVNFTTLGGGRVHELSIDDEPVNVSDKDSPERWREAIRGGTRQMEMRVDGVFKDTASETSLLNNVMDASDTVLEFQFIVPDFFTFQGLFIVSNYVQRGEDNGAAEYSATFASAGQITETAA